MQLLPHLQLQGRLGADIGAAHFAVSHRPSTGPGLCAAFLPTRGEESIMYNHSTVLVAAGSLCLTITLVLAWCLAGVRASTFMKRLFPNYQSLLKAHMDYLLMTGLLMIFYLLFAQFHVWHHR
jgi:hypothetical protein